MSDKVAAYDEVERDIMRVVSACEGMMLMREVDQYELNDAINKLIEVKQMIKKSLHKNY